MKRLHENLDYTASGDVFPGNRTGSSAYLDTWYKRDTNGLSAVAYGNGLFVGVGKQGKILTSRDGTMWTVQASGVSIDLNAVTYGQKTDTSGSFVAVGAASSVLASTNGSNWLQRNPS